MTHSAILAGSPFPKIIVNQQDEIPVHLDVISEDMDWKMVVVYRGKHCPLCTKYLNKLENYKQRLQKIGVELVAVSADDKAQLTQHSTELKVSFPIYYGLSIEQMQELGLYISNPRSKQETDHPFAEPGIFVINENGQVHLVDISNGPFARPELDLLVSGIEFIKDPSNNYPIRGTYRGHN
ncbi:AhpC/TSA family protein [Endozoicomonas sp. SM1973]|uniref:AhpC/TSA family protein n=1 Tax=Spartinivicinus marinus TaxID=2994442 RepID=A0A853IA80_9GAMM|nr:peroxiredoxin-like family protein [Spartinivicinus marinus]MCX4026894.1 peroxiredoxin-like family protein [Spartinivicinus marinus]NYZ66761.1 AhpC/TSA family protein [Spartinivicinus marinus]